MGCTVALEVAVLAGCANETGEQDVSKVAAEFLAAAGRGDGQAACALLTPCQPNGDAPYHCVVGGCS